MEISSVFEKMIVNKKLFLFFLLSSFGLTFLLLLIGRVPHATKLSTKATEEPVTEWISPKKGIGGPVVIDHNNTYDQIKISWYYDWTLGSYFDFHNLSYQYVPLFASKQYNWCLTPENKNTITNRVSVRVNDWGYRGKYWLVGNEPMIYNQDRRSGVSDETAVQDAVDCYGFISGKILEADPTAKIIILGLAHRNTWEVNEFFSRWKTKWAGTTIANLPAVVAGWHFHTYSGNMGQNYAFCPSSDEYARSIKNDLDTATNTYFPGTSTGKETWVTEMGSLANLPALTNTAERVKFVNQMACFVNVYENSDIITRYSWFYHGCNSTSGYCEKQWDLTALFTPAGDGTLFQISDLGQKYATLAYSAYGSPTPTPTPIPCEGAAEKAAEGNSTYTSNVITSASGWSYGSPAKFTPSFSGRLDKVEMVVSGSGKVEVKVRNSRGEQVGETVSKNVNQNQNWAIFDFSNEGMILKEDGVHYLDFRVVLGKVTFYRGNSWSWAHRVWLRPCQGGLPSPTLTPTPTPTPVSGNFLPVITAPSQLYLPTGYAKKLYTFYFEGYDLNTADNLSMKIHGTFPVTLGYCTQSISNGKKTIKCPFSGTPAAAGTFSGHIHLLDGVNDVTKDFKLVVQ